MHALLALMEKRDQHVAAGNPLPVNFNWRLESLGRAVLNHALRETEMGSEAAKEIHKALESKEKI